MVTVDLNGYFVFCRFKSLLVFLGLNDYCMF